MSAVEPASDKPIRRDNLTVIFKGSNRCNAGCTFCSVGEPGGRMVSREDFELVAQELERLIRAWGLTRLQFTFHGGEPTLLGPSLIDFMCRRLKRLPVPVRFAMQSNLLRWEQPLVEVLMRHGIVLGTSMDPIARDRLDGRGGDAYPTWAENYLKAAKVMKAPGAIFVVTRKALGQARQLYETAQSLSTATGRRFGLQVNPVYRQGRAVEADALHVTPREFGEFLVDMWRAWESSEKNVRLTPIQDFADHFFPVQGRKPTLSCSFKGRCAGTHVGIDFDLQVAACGRRLDSHAFIGNLREATLVELLEGSEELERMGRRNQVLREGACKDCRFFDLCAGGCADDAALGAGDVLDRFEWCASYKMLFEAMEAERNRVGGKALEPQQPRAPRHSLYVVQEPAEAGPHVESADAVWLLPTEDGRALRFGGGLGKLLACGAGIKLLFVHNRFARSLAMWEGPLKESGAQVVLFEREGLEAAVEVLSGLGATVHLEVPELRRSADGVAVLGDLLDRFVHERDFGAQLYPFAGILLRALGRQRCLPVTRWNQRPGSYAVRCPPELPGDLEIFVRELVDEARGAATATTEQWLAERPSCRDCPELGLCGTRLAPLDDGECRDDVKALVRKLDAVGRALRGHLGASASP